MYFFFSLCQLFSQDFGLPREPSQQSSLFIVVGKEGGEFRWGGGGGWQSSTGACTEPTPSSTLDTTRPRRGDGGFSSADAGDVFTRGVRAHGSAAGHFHMLISALANKPSPRRRAAALLVVLNLSRISPNVHGEDRGRGPESLWPSAVHCPPLLSATRHFSHARAKLIRGLAPETVRIRRIL